ncbi:MAG: ribosome small subunit-dependent GTPase A [Defluviitaleaceae bacterium]|nr:ribosome small subunit-dependent GTPase A [Defluviitaleaceae bacterium]
MDTEHEVYICKPKGIFRKKGIDPIVGDFVDIDIIDKILKEGTIIDISNRKNKLIRPKVANIDQSILVFSITDPPINLDLLDRLIILSEEQHLNIIIVLNKCDKYINSEIVDLYQNIGYKIIETSTYTNEGIDILKNMLLSKISVFCGQSGVGKSSLINAIIGRNVMETGEISEKGKRGKHTTTSSKLIKFENENSYIVDSPGFSNLNINIDKSNLENYFIEFVEFLNGCKFSNCEHIDESVENCNIKKNVNIKISKERYERYTKIYKELKNMRNNR